MVTSQHLGASERGSADLQGGWNFRAAGAREEHSCGLEVLCATEAQHPSTPPKRYIESSQELAAALARWITDAEVAIERLAAETGERQEQSWGMEDDADQVFLRVHLACEPRQFATRTIEGELASVARRALAAR